MKSAAVEQVDFTAVGDLRGVNALVDGQHLSFATTGVTVIYGDNGSDKSGYAGLIKAMVKARHRADILPNAPDDPSGLLIYRVGGKEQTLAFPSPPTPELLEDELPRRALRRRVPDERIDDPIPSIGADSP